MRSAAYLSLLTLAIAGCGSRDACYPVGGIVLFRNVPLAGGLIVFTPDAEKGNSGPIARAIIRTDGSFELQTDDKSGAVRGWHRITIAPPVGDSAHYTYRDFPVRFRNPADSNLSWEVKAIKGNPPEEDNQMKIELRP